jgi:DsbC/DsbD-like thiol-disulfide interchange protein
LSIAMPFLRRAELASWFTVVLIGCGGSPAAPPVSPHETTPAAASGTASPAKAAGGVPERQKPAVEREPEAVVGLSFEPLSSGVRPGGKVILAAHFRIAPGYRISWKTAGDVGSPTSVVFRAPAGFEVGPVQFPTPERYTTPGGGGIGYEKETAVFVEVKVPGNVRRDDVHRFDLDATWVACRRICATERTAAFVELTTTYGDTRVREIETTLAPFRARVPLPLHDLPSAEASWEKGPRNAFLVVKMPGAVPRDFFSDGSADPKPEKTAITDGELRFAFDEAAGAGSRPLRGIIVASVEGKEAFYDLEAPLADDDASKAAERPRKSKPNSGKKKRLPATSH